MNTHVVFYRSFPRQGVIKEETKKDLKAHELQQIVVVHNRELILVHVVLLTKARVEYTLIRRYNYSRKTDEWRVHKL